MINNYTSYEQSKRLVELGLLQETADAWYKEVYKHTLSDDGWIISHSEIPDYVSLVLYQDANWTLDRWNYVPCWSLGALIDLMKPIDGNTYSITGTLDGSAIVQFEDVTIFAAQEKTTFESVYEMVCWLLENNYLKTKNE